MNNHKTGTSRRRPPKLSSVLEEKDGISRVPHTNMFSKNLLPSLLVPKLHNFTHPRGQLNHKRYEVQRVHAFTLGLPPCPSIHSVRVLTTQSQTRLKSTHNRGSDTQRTVIEFTIQHGHKTINPLQNIAPSHFALFQSINISVTE